MLDILQHPVEPFLVHVGIEGNTPQRLGVLVQLLDHLGLDVGAGQYAGDVEQGLDGRATLPGTARRQVVLELVEQVGNA